MEEKKINSISDEVFAALENDILSGNLAHGTVVTEGKLCERYGASRTPIREAMTRLKQEGLIEERGKGAVILGIGADDISDIFELRLRIEGLAAARCAEHITDYELRELLEILELQEFYTQKGAADSIRNLDSRFHALIFGYCGSRTINSLLGELHRKLKRSRRMSVENPGRAIEAAREHRQIYEALAAHNGALAESLTILHIRNARDNIMKTMQSNNI